jgi:tetratricopeptide (TPR) repeat protein
MDSRQPNTCDLPARERRLEEAVLTFLRAADAGQPLAVSELLARYPDVAEELRAFVEDQARVSRLAEPLRPPLDTTPLPGGSGRETAADDREALRVALGATGRLELLGTGGVGEVYRGEDPVLGRELAVKVLRPEHRGRAELERRFEAEARLTGRLGHPGVVPVHALGRLPDGRPYFTMKLVCGQTLAVLLAERADPAQDRPRFLKAFEQVCQTIAYAHSKGVIHRDLKPLNVMVGAFGEVQVMDWGFAKVLGAEVAHPLAGRPLEVEDRDTPVDYPPIGRTRLGQVMGTLAYMSPEQARGEVDRLDARSDVFGLGAVLCEILTGRPPYRGRAPEEVFERARAADLGDAWARLDGCGADPELVGLAKHCLAADPSRRPRDAGEVAGAVAAYRAGVEARLQAAERERAAAEARAAEEAKTRQVAEAKAAVERRARRWTAAAAALLLTALAALVVGAVRVSLEQAKTAKQRDRAVAARTRTREALDAMVSEVTGDTLTVQKALSDEQKRFLQSVLKYYEEFAAEPGEDREGLERLAGAHLRLGLIRYRLGQVEEGAAVFRRSAELYERLTAEHPAVPEYRSDLANSHNSLGALLAGLGQRAEAMAAFRAALAVKERLAAEYPGVPEYRQDLAASHNNLGALLAGLGRRAEAETEFRAARALWEKLAAEHPGVPQYTVELGGSYCNFGILVRDRGEPAAALDWYAKAIATLQPVYRADPRFSTARQFLRNSHWGRAMALGRLGRSAEALADWERALELDDGSQRTVLRLGRAVALACAGQPAQALAAADELAGAGQLTARQLYNLAEVYALAAAQLPPAAADRSAARAVELLRQAFAKGWTNVAHMLKDADLDALRGRADYANLLWDLADGLPPGPK